MEEAAKGRVCRVCLEEAKKWGVAAQVQPRLPPAPGGNVGARCLRPPHQVLAASWSVHHLPTRPRPPSEMAGFRQSDLTAPRLTGPFAPVDQTNIRSAPQTCGC